MSEEISPSVPASGEYEPYRLTPVTRWLIDTTVAVFLAQVAVYSLWGQDVIGNHLAFSAEAWAEHRYWTLFTYAWAHAVDMPEAPGLFWLHLLVNMVPLFCLGPALEEYLGPWRFLFLYLGGAAASALIWLHFNSAEGPSVIGASGAIFAVIAAAGVAAPRESVRVLLFFVIPLPMSLGLVALIICGAEVAQVIFGWMPEVAHSAHLGGAAFGAVYLWLIRLAYRLPHLTV